MTGGIVLIASITALTALSLFLLCQAMDGK